MLDMFLVLSRFVHYAALLSLFGMAVFPLYARPAGDRMMAPKVLRAFAMRIGLSGIAWLVFTVAGMGGGLSALFELATWGAAFHTHFGVLWLGRLLLMALLVVIALKAPRTSPRIIAALAGLLVVSLAATGHAVSTQGDLYGVHIAADVLHLLAAGVWLGGLWSLGIVMAASDKSLPEVLQRFSGVGVVTVAALLASGIVNSWLQLPSFGALVGTTYGLVLLIKIALFLMMLGIATLNRFWIMPQLKASVRDRAERLKRLRKRVMAEQALGMLIVALVSVLGTLSPTLAGQ